MEARAASDEPDPAPSTEPDHDDHVKDDADGMHYFNTQEDNAFNYNNK